MRLAMPGGFVLNDCAGDSLGQPGVRDSTLVPVTVGTFLKTILWVTLQYAKRQQVSVIYSQQAEARWESVRALQAVQDLSKDWIEVNPRGAMAGKRCAKMYCQRLVAHGLMDFSLPDGAW